MLIPSLMAIGKLEQRIEWLLSMYSVSSLIRILAYPNSQKQDYNIIHKHFNDIHIVIELSVIYFSMYFTYLNFSVIRTKIFLACTEGFG